MRNLAVAAREAARPLADWLASPRFVRRAGEPLFWLLGMRPRGRPLDLPHRGRILVIRLDEIGDVVITTPFLRELRRNLPGAWISLVVKPGVVNLVERCPYVNEVLAYDGGGAGTLPLRRHGWALRVARRHLWPRRFDLAIVPRWDADRYHASFLAYFSGAPRRVGYSENVIEHKRRLNRDFDRLFTDLLADQALKHEVERPLDVIRFLGGTVQEEYLELWLDREDERFAERVLREQAVQPGEVVVGFGPSGGNSPLKQWPAANFIQLGQRIRAAHSVRILIVGSPADEALGAEIARRLAPSTLNLAGKTTLRQTAALLRRCALYVGNDAGPMHVAAAVGIPVVAIFGSSCHHRFGPWGKGHRILWNDLPCSPCFQPHHLDRCGTCIFDSPRCLLGISAEQVQQAVEEILAARQVSRDIACIPAHSSPSAATGGKT